MKHDQSYYETNDGEQLTKITDLAQLKGLPEFFFAIYQSNIKCLNLPFGDYLNHLQRRLSFWSFGTFLTSFSFDNFLVASI